MGIDASEKSALLDKRIDCLDKGFVRLIDVMGDDASIVQAARVSYGSGTKKVHEDRGLIRYLLRHAHTTPFEMVEFKFHVKLPIFVARQWIRHRTANVNEYSGRYSEMKDEFYTPSIQDIRPQSVSNKQGRSDETLPDGMAEQAADAFKKGQDDAYAQYQEFLEQGIAREIARINLPVSNYTEWYWKIDLHNLFHFLRLRIDAHAQYEIRVFAEAIAELVKPFVPHAWEAFEDYILNAHRMTAPEMKVMKHLLQSLTMPSDEQLAELGLKGREAVEFKDKMQGLFSQDNP
ncbi:MAG: FAD-dependent thymidylate synthase [Ignavibacteria bacterium]|nr:FAD-dependent thymidylate synthase [Ignavibacteria bacterium]